MDMNSESAQLASVREVLQVLSPTLPMSLINGWPLIQISG